MQLYPLSWFDDARNGFTLFRTVPLSAAIGAEVQGVDLSRIDDAQFEQLKRALFHYKIVFLRNQQLSLADQERLTLRFGEFGTDAYTQGSPGHPNVQTLLKEASTVVDRVFGEGWHTDSPFLARPPAISLLYGKDVPPWGGDTWWANSQLAYEFLSPGMKAMLRGLKVHMSALEAIRRTVRRDAQGQPIVGDMQIAMQAQEEIIRGNHHPLLRTHPDTGLVSLYVDPIYARGIEGFSEEEARPLLDYLVSHITRDEFTCRLHWTPGTFVMWDNRSCLHKAFNDYDGQRREMYRTIVNGEIPA
ncbi:MAG TPA: TauD/TfdA family dioxygenase [Pseudomonadaceae bacterium]|nr:TauD/TfdA family dioxygenase [Pseudomonadaceae bacterium]